MTATQPLFMLYSHKYLIKVHIHQCKVIAITYLCIKVFILFLCLSRVHLSNSNFLSLFMLVNMKLYFWICLMWKKIGFFVLIFSYNNSTTTGNHGVRRPSTGSCDARHYDVWTVSVVSAVIAWSLSSGSSHKVGFVRLCGFARHRPLAVWKLLTETIVWRGRS